MKCARLNHRPAEEGRSAPFGETNEVLLRSDEAAAYPIVDGYPILLAPEVLVSERESPSFDLRAPQYDEAYMEMEYYNRFSSDQAAHLREAGSLEKSESETVRQLARLQRMPEPARSNFPSPPDMWLGARMDVAAQLDSFRHLAPLQGTHVMQIGGSGYSALEFLLAGAASAVLITPMLGEARIASAVAGLLGVADRFGSAIGVAEELPYADGVVDRCYAGGCVHHMETRLAFREISRALVPGGKFAAVEPWRAPFYGLGIRLFGKREVDVHCRPLDKTRLEPFQQFFSDARSVQHQTLTRYPLIVLCTKLGMPLSPTAARKIAAFDDRVCDYIPGARGLGSGLALLATK